MFYFHSSRAVLASSTCLAVKCSFMYTFVPLTPLKVLPILSTLTFALRLVNLMIMRGRGGVRLFNLRLPPRSVWQAEMSLLLIGIPFFMRYLTTPFSRVDTSSGGASASVSTVELLAARAYV